MQSRSLVLTLAAVLAIPAASAAWGAKGDMEPNTQHDARDGYMFQAAPQSPADAGKVYFNGWFSNGYVQNPNQNPNAGQLGTGVAPVPFKAWALLGVWRDCNRDGYVGHGDPGLVEYPAALGVDADLCPPVPPPNPIPAYGWVPTHNDGTWVHELLPLGWEEWRTMWNDTDPLNGKVTVKEEDDNPFDLNDTDARVWVDLHLPTARFAGGYTCYIVPQPRGTLQTTGGMIESADCFAGFRGTDTINSLAPVIDGTPLGQLSFKDKDRDQSNSSSRLNQPNPWGKEGDPAYVDAWDCSQPQLYQLYVDDPRTAQRDTLLYANVSAPRVPPGVDPGGSPAGQVNSTEGGLDECRRSPTGNNDADVYSAVEGDVVNAARKVKPDDVLFYNEGARRHVAHVLVTDTKVPRASPGQPNDLGTRYGNAGLTYGAEGTWQGLTTMLVAPVNRNTMQANPVRHATFYASLGADATSRYALKFPGATGTYGGENCALAPDVRLFDCDAAKWWPGGSEPRTTQLGAESPETLRQCNFTGTADASGCRTYGARVGAKYQLRDVDCYDYSADALRSEGIHWGVLTGTHCQ